MLNRRHHSIAIIGAGIGGLAAAAAFRKLGLDATVYEQATSFGRVGAGIQLSPNAMKVLRNFGIEERLRAIAFEPESSLNRDAATGKSTNDYLLGRIVEQRYGAPYLTLHRADLHAALASVVPAGGIKLGRKLMQIDATASKMSLAFADGSTVEADAVIGADGVHSLVRRHIAGVIEPRSTGRVAYRATFPASRLRNVDIGPSLTKWWGRDRHVVTYFVTAARDEIHVTTSQPDKPGAATVESWSVACEAAEMRAGFMTFRHDVQGVLAAVSGAHKSAIYERDPLPAWSKGRVALLGDACHPMTPYMASGAAMAVEDAAVLARCLADDDCDTFETAFRNYETTRKPRTSVVQAGSRANTWMRTETNPDWLWGYDAWTVPFRSENASAMEALTWEA